MSTNALSSLDSLADACVALSELYVADNALVSLQGLHTKAPNLETLVRREGVCGGEEVRAVDRGTQPGDQGEAGGRVQGGGSKGCGQRHLIWRPG